jgi:hypothetical protein
MRGEQDMNPKIGRENNLYHDNSCKRDNVFRADNVITKYIYCYNCSDPSPCYIIHSLWTHMHYNNQQTHSIAY